MHKCKVKLSYRRILALVLAVCVSLLTACRKREACAFSMMSEFAYEYGTDAVIYTLGAPEEKKGAFTPEMFFTMYSADTSCVSDFAVIMLSRSVSVGECAVFVCYTEYDAITVTDLCRRRLSLFSAAEGVNVRAYTEDAFIIRRGRIVVMCALPDNTAASRIWSGILDFY